MRRRGATGFFASPELMKHLDEVRRGQAARCEVWILGGGSRAHVAAIHQYMDTMNGPADFLEVPRSPVTGTRFEHARGTKMLPHRKITADLLAHGKLKLDSSRNAKVVATFHDSCNPARAMGLLEEPRTAILRVCGDFHEMAADTIRERTLCCGGGAGLGAERT